MVVIFVGYPAERICHPSSHNLHTLTLTTDSLTLAMTDCVLTSDMSVLTDTPYIGTFLRIPEKNRVILREKAM